MMSKTHDNPVYELHPLATVFPPVRDKDATHLEESIKEDGVCDPIAIFEGKILDGRNRYEIANKLGVPFKTEVFTGTPAEAMKFVIRKNLARRQLNESQRAVIGANLLALHTGQQAADILVEMPDTEPLCTKTAAREAMADQMNVSVSSLKRAERVGANTITEVQQAVQEGTMRLGRAEKLKGLSPEAQKEAVTNPPGRRKPGEPSKAGGFADRVIAGEFDGKAFLKAVGKMQLWDVDLPAMASIITTAASRVSTTDDECLLVPLLNKLRVKFTNCAEACERGRLHIATMREVDEAE